MPLKNAGSQIAFTSVASNTYAVIIVGHVEAALVQKTLYFATQHASDGVHVPIAVWGVGALWTMEADAVAKYGDELLKQTGRNPLQYSYVDSTLWWSCTVRHDHADKMAVISCCGHIMWSSTCSSLRMTLFSPLVPHTHKCRSSMPCTSRNVTVWQTCFPETNHSFPFECTHLLIFRPFASTRHTCTSFHVSTLFGSSALTEQGITLTLLVSQEMSLYGLMCTPSACKCNQLLLVVHWSTHLSSLDSFGPFRLGVALFISSSVNPWRYSYQEPRPTETVAPRWQFRGPCDKQSVIHQS